MRMKYGIIIIIIINIMYVNILISDILREKKIVVVFRYDDYSNESSTNIESRIINLFLKYNIPSTFGVIPYTSKNKTYKISSQDVALNSEKIRLLKIAQDSGLIEVALHGYSHQSFNKKKLSEFSNVEENIQKERIQKGKKLLEEKFNKLVTTFIPPYNTYDLSTLKILEELEFKCISADVFRDAINSSKLNFLPCTSPPQNIIKAIQNARNSSDNNPIIVVLLHPYDFNNESVRFKLNLHEFENILKNICSQKDIEFININQIVNKNYDLNVQRYLRYNFILRISNTLLPNFLNLFNEGFYFSDNSYTNKVKKLFMIIILSYILYFAVSVTISTYFGLFIRSKSKIVFLICKYFGLIFLITIFVYSLRDFTVSFKNILGIFTIFNTNVGLWLSDIKYKKAYGIKKAYFNTPFPSEAEH